jgi:hypothetical protein
MLCFVLRSQFSKEWPAAATTKSGVTFRQALQSTLARSAARPNRGPPASSMEMMNAGTIPDATVNPAK